MKTTKQKKYQHKEKHFYLNQQKKTKKHLNKKERGDKMKKGLKITLVILAILIILAILFFIIDDRRVQKQEKPLFCIEVSTYRDGGTKVYYGLGYKVICFHKTFVNQNTQTMHHYNEIKIGSWFMDYDDFKEEMEAFENKIKEEQDTKEAVLRAVVVKADENHVMVMETKRNELIMLGKQSLELKQGQEIAIHFDGRIMESYPAQLGKIEKVEIVKEKSEIQIPEQILRYCYSSKNKVSVTISEFTNTGISFMITDENQLPYQYAHRYKINQKVKNRDYTGVGYQIGENTGNSTAGYTRNRRRIYLGRSEETF